MIFSNAIPAPAPQIQVVPNNDYTAERFYIPGMEVYFEGAWWKRKYSSRTFTDAKRSFVELTSGTPMATPLQSWNGYTNSAGCVCLPDKTEWLQIVSREDINILTGYRAANPAAMSNITDLDNGDTILVLDARTPAQISAGSSIYSILYQCTQSIPAGVGRGHGDQSEFVELMRSPGGGQMHINSSVATADFQAFPQEIRLVDLTTGSILCQPPVSPAIGTRFQLATATASGTSYTLTIDFTAQLIMGQPDTYVIGDEIAAATFTYYGASLGWHLTAKV
jgi:hypothetical protein